MSNYTPESMRAMLDDAHARQIEAMARLDADAGAYKAPAEHVGMTYQQGLLMGAMNSVYHEQHRKRAARLARMNEKKNGA